MERDLGLRLVMRCLKNSFEQCKLSICKFIFCPQLNKTRVNCVFFFSYKVRNGSVQQRLVYFIDTLHF